VQSFTDNHPTLRPVIGARLRRERNAGNAVFVDSVLEGVGFHRLDRGDDGLLSAVEPFGETSGNPPQKPVSLTLFAPLGSGASAALGRCRSGAGRWGPSSPHTVPRSMPIGFYLRKPERSTEKPKISRLLDLSFLLSHL